jgi:HTH-type transcriptional regulator / antitoxin HigA
LQLLGRHGKSGASEVAGDSPMSERLHPGIHLAEELQKRGWNQTDLTFVLGCHPKAVNQIINGKQGISPTMSRALGQALSLPDDHFADLQKAFDLACASPPDPAVALRAKMRTSYPIREMIRRGWLSDGGDLGNQLAKLFQVNDLTNVPHLAHAAKKASYRDISPPQLAWLYRIRQIAKTMAVPKYVERSLDETIPRLRKSLVAPEEARHVPRLLGECGVRFIIAEALPHSKIDGVCVWLDARSPVIGLSMRFDRIDNFWFVVRHEIEHVLRGDGRHVREGMVDTELHGEKAGVDESLPEEERIANAAAADFCVPADKMKSFIARKHPLFYEKDVLAFSRLNGVHPGLTVGQIQHHTGQYDYLKKHQVKVRQFVLPGATVDGWGQTAAIEGMGA